MAKTGCNYLGTNVKVTVCNCCENIDKNTLNSCPKCKSPDVSHATRIIGYLKKIDSFSNQRQLEAKKRYYHK
jgi:anaerobic ribonucleoside-triphosphate reductase